MRRRCEQFDCECTELRGDGEPRANVRIATSANRRRVQYISPSNTQLTITVTPFGGASVVFGPTACSSGTCAISFTAAPGPNTIAFALSEVSNNVLSRFGTTTIVQPATLNTLNFSSNPFVNSVSLGLASPSVPAGTAISDLITVNALDVAGNMIVDSDRYIDANGNPLAITLNVTNNRGGGKGTVSRIGPTRITAPGQAATYARYDGVWFDNAVVAATPFISINGSVTGAVLTSTPTVVAEYARPSGSSPVALPPGPTAIWVCDVSEHCDRAHHDGRRCLRDKC